MLIKNRAQKAILWLAVFVIAFGVSGIVRAKAESFVEPAAASSSDKEIITVFIHGTLFPLMSWLVHKVECPMGLTPAALHQDKYVLGRIGYILDKADKEKFPLASCYLFGWSGKLSFDARERAAQELYKLVKDKKRIRIIAHSHGCNVVANLAKIVDRLRDVNFTVEELVLLAPPVQHATKHYIKLPVFKKVRSFYSKGDYVQVIDPQGMYKKNYRRKRKKKVPFFSERRYPASTNLVQTEVLLNDHNPAHLDFILPKFMEHLPALLTCIDSVAQVADITADGINCCVNISPTKSKIKFSINKEGKNNMDYYHAPAA